MDLVVKGDSKPQADVAVKGMQYDNVRSKLVKMARLENWGLTEEC